MIYLFSSFLSLPERFFQGYAFVGPHYVFGAAGARTFRDRFGLDVEPGEDGCYVTTRPRGGGIEIGVDHAGLKKLFYYSHDGVWCVSNSLTAMCDHLRQHGVTLTADLSQLAGLRAGTSFAEQMTTCRTVFVEVRLLPRFSSVLVAHGRLAIEKRTAPSFPSYEVALQEWASTWVRRLMVLLTDPRVEVSTDLSGGLDSRATFALLMAARDRLGSGAQPVSVTSGIGRAQRRDLEVASQLSTHYGVGLNEPARGPSRTTSLADGESYGAWRSLCLGVYLPVYFPQRRPSAWDVNVSGLGGENHRPFYPVMDPSEFVDQLPCRMERSLADAWRSSVVAELEELGERHPLLHPLVSHYREFRSRLHGGLFSQYKVNITPLGSRLLDRASDGRARLTNQIFFDAMESLAPGLMDFPYDLETKGPTTADRSAVRLVELGDLTPGEVFVDSDASDPPGHPGTGTPIERLRADLEEADSGSRRVRTLLGDVVVDNAHAVVAHAATTGRLGHARRASDVSRVLTASFVFSGAGTSSLTV